MQRLWVHSPITEKERRGDGDKKRRRGKRRRRKRKGRWVGPRGLRQCRWKASGAQLCKQFPEIQSQEEPYLEVSYRAAKGYKMINSDI